MSSLTISNAIADYIKAQQVSAISPISLVDVNWSVRFVHSSSKSNDIGEPRVILQLRLLDKTSENQNRWVTLELTQAELDDFIAKLEHTSSMMHLLSK
eukprot:UN02105